MTQAAEETIDTSRLSRGDATTAVLHHVGFMVAEEDFQTMIDWYSSVLDMEVNYRGGFGPIQVCFLTNDDANHRIVFIAPPGVTRDPAFEAHARLQHSAYEFPSVDGLLEKYAQLKERGILPYMCVDHGLSISIYYWDPHGYGIELQVDAHGSWRDSKKWMNSSEEFIQNLFGILFDPDQMLEDTRNGLSLEEIHRKAYYDGAYPPTPEQRKGVYALYGEQKPSIWDHKSWDPDHPTFA